LSRILLVGDEYVLGEIVRAGRETRPVIWAMFLDAIWQQPIWGYGWGQVALANSAVALMHPPMHIYFSHSHNLFLDLVLWCGLPLGLTVSCFLVWWLVSRALRVRDGSDATLMLALLVVGNHAMLELPLHHAYFLLPVGVFMGAMEVRLGVKPIWTSSRWLIGVILMASTVLLALIVRDYVRVEPAYQNLRFEWARIKTPPTQPPDVLLLTQWRDFVRMVRFDQQKDLSGADIQWMQNIARIFPSPGFFQLTAIALAQKGQPAQAARELATMCSIASDGQCAAVQLHWRALAEKDPILAAVPWPPAPIPSR
jgi:hypothetical protein